MARHAPLIQSLRRLISSPVSELTRAQRSLRYAIDLARHCARELHKDRATQVAAALTYHTLFSLLPTIVLMLVVFASFPGLEKERDDFRNHLIETLLPPADEKPLEETDAAGIPNDSAQTDGGEPTSSRTDMIYEARRHLAANIQSYMDRLENLNFGSIGVVGLLVFIYGATALLTTIERSFNMIFGAGGSRPWYLRLPMYYTVITLAPILMMAGHWLQQRFLFVLREGDWTTGLAGPMVVLTPLLTAWLVFLTMFLLLPNTRVQRRAAAVGSLVSAVGWVIGKQVFATYVMGAAVTTIYGALALLPLLLLWLWLTWLIILFGLEVTYTLQTLKSKQDMEEQARREDKLLGDPMWLLPIMAQIADAFVEGGSVTADELAQRLRLPRRSVLEFSRRLEEEGLIHRVLSDGLEKGGLALSRPPHMIQVTRLLELGRAITMDSVDHPDQPARAMLERLTRAQREAAANASLATLLEK